LGLKSRFNLIVDKTAKWYYICGMGMIEDLRRKKAEEEAAARQATEPQQKSPAELEAARGRVAQEQAEREASTRALRSSVVPQIAHEFAGLLHKRIDPLYQPNRDGMSMDVASSMETIKHRNRGDELVFETKVLEIEGQTDGSSVRIGNRILNAIEANTPTIVEVALESAYRQPKLTRSTRQLLRGQQYGGAIDDHPTG